MSAIPERPSSVLTSLDDERNRKRGKPLAGGGDGPHDSDMGTRVTKLEENYGKVLDVLGRLEAGVSGIAKDIKDIREARLPAIDKDVAVLKAELSHRPTTIQVFGAIALAVGVIAGIIKLL